MNVRGGKRKNYKRKGSGKGKKSGKVSAAVRKYVKKTISGNIENKVHNSFTGNVGIPSANTGTTGTPQIFGLVSRAISQGSQQGNRLGNQITCVGGTSKFRFNLRDYSAALNPLARPTIVKCWLVTCKNTNDFAVIEAAGFFSNFFQFGSSSTGFAGDVRDTMAAVNKELFTVHKQWKFQLGTQFNTSVAAAANYYSGDPYSREITIPYKKYLGGKWKYNDNANAVTNKNLYLVMQTVPANGDIGNVSEVVIEYHNYTNLIYEDA